MGLSGLEIYKNLPKTNCKDCGVPTCLAFAMKVASGQAALDTCPHVSDESKGALSEASAPPQALVKVGQGDKAVEVGQETVLYRHDERFHRPAAVAVRISDELDEAAVTERAKAIGEMSFERVGQTLTINMVAVENASGDPATFAKAAQLAAEASGRAVALISNKPESLKAAGEALKAERPLLWASGGGAEGAIPVAKELGLPLVLEADGFDAIAKLAEKAKGEGLKELMLCPGRVEPAAGLQFLTQSRRAAITKKFRPMGYPVAMMALNDDPTKAVIEACWYMLKYAGLIVIDTLEPHHVVSVLTTRQDIYTNPQVPVQVEAGLHAAGGEPGKDAPVLVTTNFALSYYSVEGEVESSRVPSYILAVDTEGTSVLTAWAADKFNAASITKTLKDSGVEGKVGHHKLVLPGLVAVLSAGTKDESGWEVVVGPKESSGLVSFLKNQWKP